MTTELTGILNVAKQKGWTSHDVVAKLRRLAGQRRVGHAGTLDPMAEGVLPVLLGRATRLADDIQQGVKSYTATIKLGVATATDDAEGNVTLEQPVPRLSEEALLDVLQRFEGEIDQIPPRYSALKVQGQRAYKLARAGSEIDLAPRCVTIHSLRLVSWLPPCLELDVTCSKGTYIRALARDVAAAVGTVGHLIQLTRTRVGPFRLEDASNLDDIAARGVRSVLMPASAALPDAPRVRLSAEEARRVANGQPVAMQGLCSQRVWVYDPEQRLLCLGEADGSCLRPRLML